MATNGSCVIKLGYPDISGLQDIQVLEKTNAVTLVLLGFGGFSIILALLYTSLRRYVFRDAHNLDTTFDAGGRVTLSLTVVTVMSQLLWPVDFLQSSTLATKYGLAGSLWYGIGVTLTILIFPMMSIHLKTKSPGAKTFLQIVYVRFGKPAHIVFCCMALIASIAVIAALIMSGKAAFDVLVRDVSDEMIIMVLAVIFGSYCFIGGLGTTFYIAYFTTTLIFITVLYYVWRVYYSESSDIQSYASPQALYEALKCVEAPDGQYENSYLNFRSLLGVLNGIILFLIATAIVYCDQAPWMSRIAAKPAQGVMGFLIAALLWFAIPTSVSLTSAMTYLSMSYRNGTHLLSSNEIDSGYVTPYVMQSMMGSTGGYLLITMLSMALMSTGSGEVMAVSSIIVYDIYKIYINPFSKNLSHSACILCGREKSKRKQETFKQKYQSAEQYNLNTTCTCKSTDDCEMCDQDVKTQMSRKSYGVHYECTEHGSYRHYEDMLIRYKTWCIIWVTLAHIPFGLWIMSTDINLQWAYYVLEVLLSPFLVPLLLTITWSKCTAKGAISGSISGLFAAVTALLIVASTVYPGGLSDFIVNTGSEYSVIAGLLVGIVVSCLVCIPVSMATTRVKSEKDVEEEWMKTISINNPLNPWRRIYKKELSHIDSNVKVTYKHMAAIFKSARTTAYVGGIVGFILFMFVLPGILLSFDTLDFNNFSGWLKFNHVWCLIGGIFAIFAPPIEEFIQIYRQYKLNKSLSSAQENGRVRMQTNL